MQEKRIQLYNDFRKDAIDNNLLESFESKYKNFSDWEKINFSNETSVESIWNKGLKDIFTMTLKQFYEKFVCDIQWAIDGGFCKTQSTGNTGGSTGNTGGSTGNTGGSTGKTGQQQTTTVTQQQKVETKKVPEILKQGQYSVAGFQDWLDKNYPGWAKGYPGGIMNRGKGYGEFNDVTEEQYNDIVKIYRYISGSIPKPQRTPAKPSSGDPSLYVPYTRSN